MVLLRLEQARLDQGDDIRFIGFQHYRRQTRCVCGISFHPLPFPVSIDISEKAHPRLKSLRFQATSKLEGRAAGRQGDT
jgi:hypothetical protein